MKFWIAAVLFFLPSLAFGQAGGVLRNDGAFPATGTPASSAKIGNSNQQPSSIAVNPYGQIAVAGSYDPSGNALSNIPVSNAVGLNGVGAGLVGWGLINTDTAETGSTTTVINLTAHNAKAGDIIWVNSGVAARSWSPVASVATNTVTLSNALPAAPANGDQVYIQRPIPLSTSQNTNLTGQALATFLDSSFQNSAATGILKTTQATAGTTDAGVIGLFERASATGGTDTSTGVGKYGRAQIGAFGNQLVSIMTDSMGGALTSTVTSAATSNAQTLSGGQSHMYGLSWCNTQATARYLKFHNLNGTPTCASTAIVAQFMLPGNTCFSPNLGTAGMNFSAGISICITANAGADNTAIGAGDIILNAWYR